MYRCCLLTICTCQWHVNTKCILLTYIEYIYIYIYIYVYIICIYIYNVANRIYNMRAYVYMCTRIYTYIYMYIYINIILAHIHRYQCFPMEPKLISWAYVSTVSTVAQ